jgi:hypothetical protein
MGKYGIRIRIKVMRIRMKVKRIRYPGLAET